MKITSIPDIIDELKLLQCSVGSSLDDTIERLIRRIESDPTIQLRPSYLGLEENGALTATNWDPAAELIVWSTRAIIGAEFTEAADPNPDDMEYGWILVQAQKPFIEVLPAETLAQLCDGEALALARREHSGQWRVVETYPDGNEHPIPNLPKVGDEINVSCIRVASLSTIPWEAVSWSRVAVNAVG